MIVNCQSCGHNALEPILDLGYLPPPNDYRPIGMPAKAQTWMPTPLVYCPKCELVQLAFEADPKIVFPPEYPYTSGTTKLLRDNFADLAKDLEPFNPKFVIDIGSNDGTLLSNFRCEKMGIEPTDTAVIAVSHAVPTLQAYFTEALAKTIKLKADVITCCNCFAHVPDPHDFIRGVEHLLKPNGIFVTESHYVVDLIEKIQYDTIYHEHLRYYSLRSLQNLLLQHDLEIFKVKFIPTHGGSIRVFAARPFLHTADESAKFIKREWPVKDVLKQFSMDVLKSRRRLMRRIFDIQAKGHSMNRIVGISAPSRAATIINYCRIDETMIDYIAEIEGSLKIGKYMPGTNIPVVNESGLFDDQPEYAIIFSWHIADQIQANLRAKGYRGEFILPI